MSMPYNKVKDEKVIKFKLDGQDYAIELGKHYNRL